MRRKLIAFEEGREAPEQIKKPCSDCPWLRDALNGWLGGGTPEEWVAGAHGEAMVECHVYSNVQCAGMAIYRANVCKRPRDPDQLTLPADRKIVFSNSNEFLEHHRKTPEKKLKAKLR